MNPWLIILTVSAVTFLTRAFPFLLLGHSKALPAGVQYLGQVLPSAIVAILILYCFKSTPLLRQGLDPLKGYRELMAILVVVVLHLLKRNNVLSIAGGTFIYVLLVN